MSPLCPRVRSVSLLLTLLCSLLPAPSSGQSESGAISTFIDPSIAGSGMGRTGVAVFWHEDLNDWSNPALLGYQRGLRYSRGETRLVPDLAEDVRFTSDRFAIGGWGVGVSMAGRPNSGLGQLYLDYGVSVATDEEGNPIGTFRGFEEIHQVSVGVSVIQLLENVSRAMGGVPNRLSRYGDLSIGHAWKSVVVDLGFTTLDGRSARGESKQRDRGALLRLTPVGANRFRLAGGVKLDLAGGFSQRNYEESSISLIDESQPDPILEERLVGASGRLSVRLADADQGGVWNFLIPVVSASGAWEEARYYFGGDRLGDQVIKRTGQELSLLGLISLRHGFIEDRGGDIVDDTYGVGVGLQYRGIVGARYDWAEVPQASFLSKIEREGFTIWFDPGKFVNALSDDPFGIR